MSNPGDVGYKTELAVRRMRHGYIPICTRELSLDIWKSPGAGVMEHTQQSVEFKKHQTGI